MMVTLEICCADICSVEAAIMGGAQRVELCSGLETGGLTPSPGLMTEARRLTAAAGVRLHILIRPRPGDYIYTPSEVRVMEDDIRYAASIGCDGVVIGALNPDGSVDMEVTRRLVGAAGDMSVTFHRAFDLCRDPYEALDTLVASGGIDRILTSGLAPSAPAGIGMLTRLVEHGAGHIAIMPGAGVNSGNAAAIISATGAHDIHASAKTTVASDMAFRRGDVSMGAPGADEYSRLATSASEVEAIAQSLKQL